MFHRTHKEQNLWNFHRVSDGMNVAVGFGFSTRGIMTRETHGYGQLQRCGENSNEIGVMKSRSVGPRASSLRVLLPPNTGGQDARAPVSAGRRQDALRRDGPEHLPPTRRHDVALRKAQNDEKLKSLFPGYRTISPNHHPRIAQGLTPIVCLCANRLPQIVLQRNSSTPSRFF